MPLTITTLAKLGRGRVLETELAWLDGLEVKFEQQ